MVPASFFCLSVALRALSCESAKATLSVGYLYPPLPAPYTEGLSFARKMLYFVTIRFYRSQDSQLESMSCRRSWDHRAGSSSSSSVRAPFHTAAETMGMPELRLSSPHPVVRTENNATTPSSFSHHVTERPSPWWEVSGIAMHSVPLKGDNTSQGDLERFDYHICWQKEGIRRGPFWSALVRRQIAASLLLISTMYCGPRGLSSGFMLPIWSREVSSHSWVLKKCARLLLG